MAEPAIAAHAVLKSYGHGPAATPVLRGVDLSVHPGEFVAILGPSGSGKSTLLNILGLMDRPDSGTLSLAGSNVGALGDDERSLLRNERLGFVFQFDSLLPEFTVLENVRMPLLIAEARGLSKTSDPTSDSRALELLESLGVASLQGRFPSQTSGGERQRVAIARALANSPAVILADEPTGNLDAENGAKVFADLRRAAREKNTAVVLVTHDEPSARSADRVLRMDRGHLR